MQAPERARPHLTPPGGAVCQAGGVSTPPDPSHDSRYTDPGRHAERLQELPDDIESLCAASRNVVVHYRAQLPVLTDGVVEGERRPDTPRLCRCFAPDGAASPRPAAG